VGVKGSRYIPARLVLQDHKANGVQQSTAQFIAITTNSTSDFTSTLSDYREHATMAGPLLAVLWAALAFVLYKITAYVLDEVRHVRNAKRLGCQQPPRLRSEPWEFMGVVNIHTVIKSLQAKKLPQVQKLQVEKRAEEEGRFVTTFSMVSTSENGRREQATSVNAIDGVVNYGQRVGVTAKGECKCAYRALLMTASELVR
jgi:hypothetical protein